MTLKQEHAAHGMSEVVKDCERIVEYRRLGARQLLPNELEAWRSVLKMVRKDLSRLRKIARMKI